MPLAKFFSAKGFQVIATGRREETLSRIREAGIEATRDNCAAVEKADAVIICVKPHQVHDLLKEVKRSETCGKCFISLAAGVPYAWLKEQLPEAHWARIMLNLNVLCGKTLVAAHSDDSVAKSVVNYLFSLMGEVLWVEEKELDALTGLLGSGPALVAELVDAFLMGALKAGISSKTALKVILDVFENTARTLRETGLTPYELRNLVATPGGVTIRGLMILNGGKSMVAEAVASASEHSLAIRKAFQT